jgi:hypothetical protein
VGNVEIVLVLVLEGGSSGSFRVSFDAGNYICNSGYVDQQFDGSRVVHVLHNVSVPTHCDMAVHHVPDCPGLTVPVGR